MTTIAGYQFSYSLGTGTATGSKGLWTAVGASGSAGSLAKNGTSLASASFGGSNYSAGKVCLFRSATGYNASSNARIAVYFYGGAMSVAQLTALYNRLNTYLTAIGAN